MIHGVLWVAVVIRMDHQPTAQPRQRMLSNDSRWETSTNLNHNRLPKGQVPEALLEAKAAICPTIYPRNLRPRMATNNLRTLRRRSSLHLIHWKPCCRALLLAMDGTIQIKPVLVVVLEAGLLPTQEQEEVLIGRPTRRFLALPRFTGCS